MNFDHPPFVDADFEPFAAADRVWEEWHTLTLWPDLHPGSHLSPSTSISGSVCIPRPHASAGTEDTLIASVVPADGGGLTITF